MVTEGVYVSPSGKKTFVTLENNPDVFAALARGLGVSPRLGFYDVYSVEDGQALSSAPRPALALVFLTPPDMYRAVRTEDGLAGPRRDAATLGEGGSAQPVMWFRQTIGDACRLMALLHCVASGRTAGFVEAGPDLHALLRRVAPMGPAERAAALSESAELERAHIAAARLGDTVAPRAEDHAAHHFLAFVKGDDGHLWELEGSVDGPIDRGDLGGEDDLLSARALGLGVARFLKHAAGNLEFSLVALAKRPVE